MKGVPAMKKLTAAAAAIATALNAAALSANAMFENVPAGRIWDEEIEMFPMMENGDLVTDIDGNGSFDLTDCALFFGYTVSSETDETIAENIASIGDYDNNGEVDRNDAEHLIRFYLLNNGLKIKDLSSESYTDIDRQYTVEINVPCHFDSMPERSLSDDFIDELSIQSNYLMASYPTFCEAALSGDLNCDVNGDGTYDYADLNYLWLYGYNKHFFMFSSLPDEEKPAVPEEITERCKAAYDYVSSELMIDWFYEYAEMYCIEKNGVTSKQFDEAYYDSLLEGSGKFALAKCLRFNCNEWLSNSEYTEYNGALFNREFTDYWKILESGEAQLPDTDGDGVIGITDLFNTIIYSEDLQSASGADASVLPKNVWKFFSENCDINGNGLSGDVHDLKILDLAYSFNISDEETDELYGSFQESYSAYVEMLADINGISSVKYHPEKLSPACTSDVDVERSGDANSDGNVDLSDAVKIMQALANPDRYQLSCTERFNGDVNNTGDGITVGDAQMIQTRLLDQG
jgi:hypothetical protein